MRAKKKPVIIDYFSWEPKMGQLTALKAWVESFGQLAEDYFLIDSLGKLRVKTLEGTSYEVTEDDIIIRGVKGEYYPCKKDIFEQTYDRIDWEDD